MVERRKSYALQFLTKHNSAACWPGTSSCRYNPNADKTEEFFDNEHLSCEEKKNIVEELNAGFIASPFNIDCSWANEMYRNERIYVYEFLG